MPGVEDDSAKVSHEVRWLRNSVDVYGGALGLFATVSQVVLMREALEVTGGNELAVSLGFAAWLIGVGAGALAAVPLSRLTSSVVWGSLLAPPAIAAGLMLLRMHRLLISVLPGADPTLFQLLTILFAGVGIGGLCAGCLFTVAARRIPHGRPLPVSRLYAAEAVGALLGGLLFTFVLEPWTSHLVSLCVAGGLLLVAASGWAASGIPRTAALLGAAALVLWSGTGGVAEISRKSLHRALALIREGEVLSVEESPYGRLALLRNEDEYEILADGRTDHTFPDPWERPVPIHLALSQHPGPKRILLVGGGPTDRLEAALSHRPGRVVLTYLDPKVHDMCRPFWPAATRAALSRPEVAVVQNDGRRYLKYTGERFDTVVVDAPAPLSAGANRYHTVSFYEAVKRVLAPGGSMTAASAGSANVLAPEAARAAASTLATLKRVFRHVVVVPGIPMLFHASDADGVVTARSEVLAKRYRDRGVVSDSFSWRRFSSLMDPGRMADVSAQIAKWPAVVNTDGRPLVYLANLQLWERSLSRAGEAGKRTVTGLLERYAWVWLLVPIGIFAIRRGGVRLRRRPVRRGALFPIATTGAAGMGMEVILLFSYQSIEGRLYTGLALLVALFMAGLASGAFLGRRFLGAGDRRDALIAEIGVLIFLGGSAGVLTLFAVSALVPLLWSVVAGLVTGAAFPALLGLAAGAHQGDERRAAAAIEAADHLGAAFGAVVTGVVWLPVYGIAGTCLLFAVLKGVSFFGLAGSRPGRP